MLEPCITGVLMIKRASLYVIALGVPLTAFAGSVGTLVEFQNGTPAVASEVMANYTAIRDAVNDTDSRLGLLESEAAYSGAGCAQGDLLVWSGSAWGCSD